MNQFDRDYKHFINWFTPLYSTYSLPEFPNDFYTPIRYSLRNTGKQIRPALLTLIAQSYGFKKELSLPAAISIEMIHNFSLVHDDIMDGDTTRHGMETVQCKWDINTGILAGDGIYTLAIRELFKLQGDSFKSVMRLFTDSILEICEGQSYDLEFESRENVTISDYLTMIEKKTASLLSAAAVAGAVLGGASQAEQDIIADFVKIIGRIFQIQDDLLELTSSAEIMGKSLGSDIIAEKKTYPILLAFQEADKDQRIKMKELMNENYIQKHGINPCVSLMKTMGVFDSVQITIKNEMASALSLSKKLPPHAGNTLNNFAEFILNRKK